MQLHVLGEPDADRVAEHLERLRDSPAFTLRDGRLTFGFQLGQLALDEGVFSGVSSESVIYDRHSVDLDADVLDLPDELLEMCRDDDPPQIDTRFTFDVPRKVQGGAGPSPDAPTFDGLKNLATGMRGLSVVFAARVFERFADQVTAPSHLESCDAYDWIEEHGRVEGRGCRGMALELVIRVKRPWRPWHDDPRGTPRVDELLIERGFVSRVEWDPSRIWIIDAVTGHEHVVDPFAIVTMRRVDRGLLYKSMGTR